MKAIAKTYGRWTVLSTQRIYEDDPRFPKIRCICSCGTEKLVHLHRLRAGKSLSCGCYKKDRLTQPWENPIPHKTYTNQDLHPGNTIWRFTILSDPYTGKDRKRYIDVECQGSQEHPHKIRRTVNTWNLLTGNTKSCGCYKTENSTKNFTRKGKI
jgi:hypothetical protein